MTFVRARPHAGGDARQPRRYPDQVWRWLLACQWLGSEFARLDHADGLDATLRPFHSRPAQVLLADRYADACLTTVTDPALRSLPLIGAVDQLVDSTDALSTPSIYRRLVTAWPGLGDASAADRA